MLYTIRSGVTNHPESTVLQFETDLLDKSGIISADDFAVIPNSPTPDLSVNVNSGRAYIKRSGNAYPVYNSSQINLAITANSGTQTRYDCVVLYIDMTVIPESTGEATDVAKCEVITGSSSVVSDDFIISQIGAMPFIRLADITVPSESSAISANNIASTRYPARFLLKRQDLGVTAITNLATQFNYDANYQFSLTLTSATTIPLPTNLGIGQWIYLTVLNSGGSLTWNSSYKQKSADMSIADSGKTTDFMITRKSTGYEVFMVGKEY